MDIRTTMQSSVAMQQSCTRRPRQLFLSSEQGTWRRGRRWRIRTTIQSSVAMQQSCTRWPRPLFLFSKQGVEDGRLEGGGGERGGGGGGRGGGGGGGGGGGRGGGGGGGEGGGGGRGRGGDYNCNAVFRSNAAELYLSAKAIVSFQ